MLVLTICPRKECIASHPRGCSQQAERRHRSCAVNGSPARTVVNRRALGEDAAHRAGLDCQVQVWVAAAVSTHSGHTLTLGDALTWFDQHTLQVCVVVLLPIHSIQVEAVEAVRVPHLLLCLANPA